MGYYLPLTEVNCHYLCPARYDQIVLIETQIIFVKRASIKFRFLIWDEKQEKTLAEGESVHACINKQGKIVRIPREITEQIDPER